MSGRRPARTRRTSAGRGQHRLVSAAAATATATRGRSGSGWPGACGPDPWEGRCQPSARMCASGRDLCTAGPARALRGGPPCTVLRARSRRTPEGSVWMWGDPAAGKAHIEATHSSALSSGAAAHRDAAPGGRTGARRRQLEAPGEPSPGEPRAPEPTRPRSLRGPGRQTWNVGSPRSSRGEGSARGPRGAGDAGVRPAPPPPVSFRVLAGGG